MTSADWPKPPDHEWRFSRESIYACVHCGAIGQTMENGTNGPDYIYYVICCRRPPP